MLVLGQSLPHAPSRRMPDFFPGCGETWHTGKIWFSAHHRSSCWAVCVSRTRAEACACGCRDPSAHRPSGVTPGDQHSPEKEGFAPRPATPPKEHRRWLRPALGPPGTCPRREVGGLLVTALGGVWAGVGGSWHGFGGVSGDWGCVCMECGQEPGTP